MTPNERFARAGRARDRSGRPHNQCERCGVCFPNPADAGDYLRHEHGGCAKWLSCCGAACQPPEYRQAVPPPPRPARPLRPSTLAGPPPPPDPGDDPAVGLSCGAWGLTKAVAFGLVVLAIMAVSGAIGLAILLS